MILRTMRVILNLSYFSKAAPRGEREDERNLNGRTRRAARVMSRGRADAAHRSPDADAGRTDGRTDGRRAAAANEATQRKHLARAAAGRSELSMGSYRDWKE